ncbi:MAG: preprotein translocase subunit SecA [Actinomycetota bacterium]|nr:preprotein translocase subunit SecA [Actinomycetota bacterium]
MVLEKILRAGEGKILRRLKAYANAVNSLEDEYSALSDAELRELTDTYKERVADGESLDHLLPEAFASVREAAKRTLGQRHFDVQLMGGAALHLGNIAEMKTGEGKTLVGTLPAYLNALAGNGVHIVTVNDYLAQRDAEWMGRVHRFLGLDVGVILGNQPAEMHRAAYACDITYGTNNEFGFDYLRDNMAWSHEELVQRGHYFAIVDEVDSILIDEARTPLIISGPTDAQQFNNVPIEYWYKELARITKGMKGIDSTKYTPQERTAQLDRINADFDHEIDQKKRTVEFTDKGVKKIEDELGISNLYESHNTPLVGFINNALKAMELYKKDRDYIIVDKEVLIVDEFTGRVLHGRRYNEGMHQAIEAKEGVLIKDENQTLATITLQNYFRLYDKLAGMTGTAMTEASEFQKTYNVGVVPIPTHRNMIRLDKPDVVYKTEKAKFEAVVDDIAERVTIGQPVLVGTVSVEKSEVLSGMLLRRGVPHEVLNAKQHEKEAAIVAQAGRKGAVTVATNMAGRGTDIVLGGNSEFLAAAELRARGLSPVDDPEGYEAAWPAALEKAESAVEAESQEVVEAGGLYVLGTERHESRRIDNQLRGRSGRQGDPGESRFYLSLGDDLMQRFNATAVETIMDRLNIPDDIPIESKMVTRSIRSAQTQVEQQNAEIRKNILKYDEVLNLQRTVIYDERRRVLAGEDLHEQVRNMIDDVIETYIVAATSEGYAEDWDLEQLWADLGRIYPVGVTAEELEDEAGGDRSALAQEFLVEQLRADANAAYDRREEELGADMMRELERQVVLSVVGRKWREHLYEMDYLQEGIGLRAYAQRDPVVEYKRESFDMFAAMMEGIKEESVRDLFHVEVRIEAPAEEEPAEEVPAASAVPNGSARSPGGGRHAAPDPTSPPRLPELHLSGLVAPSRPANLQYTSPSIDGDPSAAVNHSVESGSRGPVGPRSALAAGERQVAPGQVVGSEPSRNEPCPCGSGRKYKRCHGAPGAT